MYHEQCEVARCFYYEQQHQQQHLPSDIYKVRNRAINVGKSSIKEQCEIDVDSPFSILRHR